MTPLLSRIGRVSPRPRSAVDSDALSVAEHIMRDIEAIGESALRKHAEAYDGLGPADPIVIDRDGLEQARDRLPVEQLDVLERVAARIRVFAEAQRDALVDVDVEVAGGRAGHRWIPVETVGAYAPGGRYPLPSSVLMTVVPAEVAGVETVWVASPRPTDVTLASASIAGADGLLRVGGAQAIAALAYGSVSPPCDLIVGPGNKYVTAAKKLLFGEVGIDGLAGPSEILVIADKQADPVLVAADLLAQAEHDEEAVPMLISTSQSLITRVEEQLTEQLGDLPTSSVAREGAREWIRDDSEDIDRGRRGLGPDRPRAPGDSCRRAGSSTGEAQELRVGVHGREGAEVFADYGVGPNHVLPTGGGARFQSGLSVMTYLRSPTWSRLDDPAALIDDTVLLARLEGLEAHARAALRRVDPEVR